MFTENNLADNVAFYAKVIMLAYLLFCFIFVVFGTDTISKRSKVPFSTFHSKPKVFIAYHVSMVLADLVQLFIYCLGGLVGVLLSNTFLPAI